MLDLSDLSGVKEIEQEGPLYCSACGKDMTDPETGNSMTGCGFKLRIVDTTFPVDFVQKQMGEFVIDKEYNVCFECWLKSVGFKP